MRRALVLALGLVVAPPAAGAGGPLRVSVPLVEGGDEVDLSELVDRLAKATGLDLARPPGDVTLPVVGLAGNLSRTLLVKSLGAEVVVSVVGRSLVAEIPAELLAPERRADWERRVRGLAASAEREAKRRQGYGLHALKSYRPNDPNRPTVCLVHGVNSSSGGFVHMVPPLEAAGFGVVVYDYPFNRSLEASSARFSRDWAGFRKQTGDTSKWAVVGHSMGCLLARDYVEGPSYGGDVSDLILIAPVNQGSHLARTQTLLQLANSLRAVNGRRSQEAIAHLGDGLGEAALDMTPGSTYLKALNARPRRAGVNYHTLAGDVGVISASTRRAVEGQVGAALKQGGVFGGVVRAAAGSDLSDRLDELTDGDGDGCVSLAGTRLDGAPDPVVIHANHAELIRAPLLFPDPGPVACMPQLLRWLGKPPAPAEAPPTGGRQGLGNPGGLR